MVVALKLRSVTTLLVGFGGTLGVLARYGVSRLTLHTEALIWSTVGINIVGSFLLGLLVAGRWFDRDLREALGVGLLGGFTTFSTFSVQIVLEVDAGESARAAGYLVASVVGGVAAAAAGYALGRNLA
jgi:fluoride exporter